MEPLFLSSVLDIFNVETRPIMPKIIVIWPMFDPSIEPMASPEELVETMASAPLEMFNPVITVVKISGRDDPITSVVVEEKKLLRNR